ncbi:MAG: hypothetical protein LBU88_04570 [Treponema sp.]|jgi:hypothetical protein|nr:hypothetical protein [Treponema sp.]
MFFLAAHNLYAQIPSESRFYVLPITGSGTKQDKAFLYDRINYEVAFQNYLLVWARRESDYIFRGTIQFVSGEYPEYILNIRLMSSRTNKVLSEKQLIFYDINDSDDISQGITRLMTDFFLQVPDETEAERPPSRVAQRPPSQEPEPAVPNRRQRAERPEQESTFVDRSNERLAFSDDWRDKLFFFEYSLIWAPREYVENDSINYINLGLNFALEMQFLNFLAIEVGAQFIQETSGGNKNRDLLLEFPAALKIVLKPGKAFMFEIYGGVSFNFISFMNVVTPSRYSVFGGLEICLKTNSGIFVIEPRYAMDINNSNLGSGLEHKRKMVQVGIGYKTGLFTKLVRKQD